MIKIYTRRFCSYCTRAKNLLKELEVPFLEIPVDHDPAAFQEMREQAGRTSVPQIWAGQTHIGGCDELVALHRSGQLSSVLAGSLL